MTNNFLEEIRVFKKSYPNKLYHSYLFYNTLTEKFFVKKILIEKESKQSHGLCNPSYELICKNF